MESLIYNDVKYIKLFENFNSLTSIEEFIKKLKEYSIPVEKYGTGVTKTIQHLFNEIQEGESRIEEENGSLVRYIEFVGIKIFYIDKIGTKWFLKEDRQEFKDGRTRNRGLNVSVAEKMKPGEDPLQSAIRGIEEELKIEISTDQIREMKSRESEKESGSYPGFKTKYNEHPFICYINKSQFNPKGYIEHQKDKSTFFIWIKQ